MTGSIYWIFNYENFGHFVKILEINYVCKITHVIDGFSYISSDGNVIVITNYVHCNFKWLNSWMEIDLDMWAGMK